jgi:ADP-ribosylglycohydrolase
MSPNPARETWIRSLWQLEVREGVFIHPTADVVQEMGNKGYDVTAAEALVAEGHQLYKEDRLQELLLLISDINHLLRQAKIIHPKRLAIPKTLDEIRATWPKSPAARPPALEPDVYYDKVYGAWLGKCIGGALGMPVEGWTYERIISTYGDIRDYVVKPPETLNDDTGYGILLLHAIEEYGPDFTSVQLGREWVAHLPLETTYTAERAAIENMLRGIFPPESGETDNPYNWWVGGLMKGEVCGLLAPGRPELAAELAIRDGVIAHSGEGVYGEIFCAVLVSAAFYETDMHKLLETALAYIPPQSKLSEVVRQTMAWCTQADDWHEPMCRVYETYATQYHWVHTFPNAAIAVIGLLFGKGDFEESLRITALCGLDADTTASQVGALMGVILGESGIPAKWKDPLGDRLETYVEGYESMRITELVKKVIELAKLEKFGIILKKKSY